MVPFVVVVTFVVVIVTVVFGPNEVVFVLVDEPVDVEVVDVVEVDV